MKDGKLHLWLLRFLGLIVPQRLRADWRQEWEAELQWRAQQLAEWGKLDRKHKLDLLWHSAGAFVDALWLQPKRWEDEMIQDVRYGLRMMTKHRATTLLAIVTLAFGIGANTTIFSVMEAVILHPFVLPQQERLVAIKERIPSLDVKETAVTGGALQAWRQQSQTFEQFVTTQITDFEIRLAGQPELVSGYHVSANYFAALGVSPLLGRTFQEGEDTAGREQVVILKYSLWRDSFGADPKIIGQPITLSGKSYTVIGVMPEDFRFPYRIGELWTPYVFPAARQQDWEKHQYEVIGLLKPGLTRAQGEAELQTLAQRAQRLHPTTNQGVEVVVRDLLYEYTGKTRVYLPFTLGAVWFVLLIACANVANLLLVRGAARQRELAVRQALGASRLRIVRQMLTESVLLSLLGGGCGFGLAHFGVTAMKNGIPHGMARFIPGWEHLGLNAWAFRFTLAASLLTGVLFGFLPAWQATRGSLVATLKDGGKGVSDGGRARLRHALVSAEVALSFVLLIGAGLVVRSFINVLTTDLGYAPDNTLSMYINLPQARYPEAAQRLRFLTELERRVTALPGVAHLGVGTDLPGGWGTARNFAIVGQASLPTDVRPSAGVSAVSPGYFAATGIPLRAGRLFSAQDDGQQPVALVNEAFARRYFPQRQAVGERLRLDERPPLAIVGVVGNVMNNRDDEPEPTVYQPFTQDPINDFMVIVRGQPQQTSTATITNLMGAIRQELAGLDPNLAPTNVKTLLERLQERTAPQRLIAAVLSVFGLLALLLATVGLYAVMSFAVAQRTSEIGIRLALGAQRREVAALIMKQGLRLLGSGVVVGLAGALALSRLLSQLLFGLTATDPLTFTLVTVVLLVTAVIACWLPAWRATKVDPLIALRHD